MTRNIEPAIELIREFANADDVATVDAALTRILAEHDIKLSDNQYCALLSFVYSVGISAFMCSALFRDLCWRSFSAVPRHFKRWTVKDGKVLPELKQRRMAEAKLWVTQ